MMKLIDIFLSFIHRVPLMQIVETVETAQARETPPQAAPVATSHIPPVDHKRSTPRTRKPLQMQAVNLAR